MATTMLILRGTDLLHAGSRSIAAATSLAILIYAAHNLLASIAASIGDTGSTGPAPASSSPRARSPTSLPTCCSPSSPADGPCWSWRFCWPCIGIDIGLAETAESALVGRLPSDHLRGSGFGLVGGVQSFGDLASSAVVGLLWIAVSPTAGFLYACGWMMLVALATLRRGLIAE